MLGFSAGLTSYSRKQKLPSPLKMPEFKSATTADPSTYTKKRREKSEEDKGTESKNTTAKPVISRKSQATTRRVTPIDAARDSSTERRLRYAAGLTSSSRKQISPKPLKRPESATTVVPPTHMKVVPPKKIVPPTYKKEEDKGFESTTTTAKSVISRSKSQVSTRSPRGRDSNIEKQLRFSGGLTSSFREQKSPKPLKKPETTTTLFSPKKRQEESEGEKGFESTTTTVKSVIPSSKSKSTTRRVTSSGAVLSPRDSNIEKHIEKHFPNGELYIGCFSGNSFHGPGKYLWKDGSMYEGEWKRGKATGKGKFSWPSGASFKGEFKSGLREGSGTFTDPDGDIYKGSWLADQRHGHGVRYYCNGNYYEGHWWRNLQDGQGQYVWRNGNKYTGEWKNGVINGRGILVLANGNRYEGNWENGVPKENVVLTWPDGSCYIGSWVRYGKNQVVNGTFFPSLNNNDGSLEAGSLMMEEGFGGKVVAVGTGKKRSSVDGGGRGSMVERNFPRICIWVSDAEAGDITGDIIHTVEASMMYRDGSGFERDVGKQFRRNPCSPGMTISKGHKNYDLMLNLQLGIRHSVEKDAFNIRGLKQSDYDPKEKFWTRFPLEGSKSTPPHQSADFRWKDYCPMVFRHLRQLFQVDPAEYMLAICGSDALREFSSPGKSGSFFYLTQDDRFIIKTVKKSEVKVLIKMLRSYHNHVRRYENSLVTKFYGVHCVKPVGGTKTRFIVMGNLFCSEYRIQRRFDLKGSSYGRTIDKAEGEIDETTTLKDLDLNYVFRLQENSHEELIKQIQRDCEFLEAEKIMDYSFLVGMHFRNNNTGDKMGLSPYSCQNEKFMRSCRFHEAELQDLDCFRSDQKPLIRLGAHMPARAERVARKSDFDQYTPVGEIYEVALYFGVIDILQNYDISKKLEHAYKSLQVDPTSISAVDPKLYSKRFQDFIGRVFLPDR